MDGFNKYLYLIPLIRYSGYIPTFYNNRPYSNNYNEYRGFDRINITWEHIPFYKQKITISEKKIYYLQKFIDECKNNNIKLNFVNVPDFVEVKKLVENYTEVQEYIKQFADKNNIPFDNYSQVYFSNDSSYFYNIRHLNGKGADKFCNEFYIPLMKKLYQL